MSSDAAYDILLEDTIEWIAEHLGPAALVVVLFIIALAASNYGIQFLFQLISYKNTQIAKSISIIITLWVLIGGIILLLLALGLSSSAIFTVGVGSVLSFFVLPCSNFLYDIFAGIVIYITGRITAGEEIVFKGFIGEVHGIVKSINTTHTSILQKNNIIIDIQNSNIYSGWISHIHHGSDYSHSPSQNTSINFVQKTPLFSL